MLCCKHKNECVILRNIRKNSSLIPYNQRRGPYKLSEVQSFERQVHGLAPDCFSVKNRLQRVLECQNAKGGSGRYWKRRLESCSKDVSYAFGLLNQFIKFTNIKCLIRSGIVR